MGPSPPGGRRWPVVSGLGIVEIFAWGSSYYLLAPLAGAIVQDTGWPLPWVVGALSLGLFVAGLASPRIGRAIGEFGGRPVMAAGMMLLAAGLLILALAPTLPVFFLGWAIIGLGMAAGLYDPSFATLGRLYGRDARSAITALTLWGGFASTACWPLSALGVEAVGWRWTAAGYAALHLCLTMPLVLWTVPREARMPPPVLPQGRPRNLTLTPSERTSFTLLATLFSAAAVIAAIVSVHLITLLEARGVGAAAAVAVGALIGPAQVASRIVEMASGGRHHPRWTLLFAAALLALGLAALGSGVTLPGIALVLYGGGNGLLSIARGALPLAIFGAERYPAVMGAMARPALVAQALAPMVGALAISGFGAGATLIALAVLGLPVLAIAVALAWRRAEATA